MVHNHYQQLGGEDISFKAETLLLRQNNHEVICYERFNNEIDNLSVIQKTALVKDTLWSTKTYNDIIKIIRNNKIDLIHVQNFFPLISPSVFYASNKGKIPVVFSVRNYRLFCLNGLYSRNQLPCELCTRRNCNIYGVLFKCYRHSIIQSSVVAAMQNYHKMRKTWNTQITRLIAISDFAKNKLIDGGINPAIISVKGNFVEDPGVENIEGQYAIFVGRLSKEKGIITLLQAWENISNIPLIMVGDGPLITLCQGRKNITVVGHKKPDQTLKIIQKAKFLIFPTELYETFGRVVIEAYACGKPVIASNIGAVKELVRDHDTGLFFEPGDSKDLQEKVNWLIDNPLELQRMGKQARKFYEQKYSPEQNYLHLIDIYQQAISELDH